MSVVMYLGLPGDGKSLSGVKRLVKELVETKRHIITNLPLEMGELKSYMVKNHGADFDCETRVVHLEQKQVRKFWLRRANGACLLDIPEEQYGRNQTPDLTTTYGWKQAEPGGFAIRPDLAEVFLPDIQEYLKRGELERGTAEGVLYIIDEAQNFWPSRSYQTTPKGLMFYLSQHRHLGDDCVFITQKETQVEKVVRNLVAQYWVFRNLGNRQRMGFRLPGGMFSYARFAEPPGGVGALYEATGVFRLDAVGLGQCYRTADGVGVGGPTMTADTKQKKDGKHWSIGVAIIVAILLLIGYLPIGGTNLLSKWMLDKEKSLGTLTNSMPAFIPRPQAPSPVMVAQAQSNASVTPKPEVKVIIEKEVPKPEPEETINIKGAFKGDDGWVIALSNGRIVGEDDVERIVLSVDEKSLRRIRMNKKMIEWGFQATADGAARSAARPKSQ